MNPLDMSDPMNAIKWSEEKRVHTHQLMLATSASTKAMLGDYISVCDLQLKKIEAVRIECSRKRLDARMELLRRDEKLRIECSRKRLDARMELAQDLREVEGLLVQVQREALSDAERERQARRASQCMKRPFWLF
jgi:hypothetical protein